MVFTIKTTKERYFFQALKVLQNLPPFNTLREKELQVLAHLLHQNLLLEESGVMNEQVRQRILFDIETKTKICAALDITDAVLRNNIHALRKKGFLNGVVIHPRVRIPYGIELVFHFADADIEMTELASPKIAADEDDTNTSDDE